MVLAEPPLLRSALARVLARPRLEVVELGWDTADREGALVGVDVIVTSRPLPPGSCEGVVLLLLETEHPAGAMIDLVTLDDVLRRVDAWLRSAGSPGERPLTRDPVGGDHPRPRHPRP